jgi:hypothetical protein
VALGGTSVWEEKLGLLQIQVEDLQTILTDHQEQNQRQARQLMHHRAEILDLHRQWNESIDRCKAEEAKQISVTEQNVELQASIKHQIDTIDRLKGTLHERTLDCARYQRQCEHANDERDAAIRQRADAIEAQNAAIALSLERTKDWKAAEHAAVIMETQRNMAFQERDTVSQYGKP